MCKDKIVSMEVVASAMQEKGNLEKKLVKV